MKALAAVSQDRAGPKPPPARPLAQPVQCKGKGCACGGGCPGCKENDAAEQEADKLAEQVLSGGPGAASGEPPPIQAKAEGTPVSGVAPEPGPGRTLPMSSRGFFETRFGADFSDVHVHDGPQAQASAEALQARAYTSGSHLVFAKGEFAPGTPRGDKLIAHELTHVLQQRYSGSAIQRAPADDEIGGRRSGLVGRDDLIYFERGSSALHLDEKAKIPNIVSHTKPDIRIKGFRSRDEDASLAQARADSLETEIKAHDKKAKTVTQSEASSFQDQYDYRRFRVASADKDTVASAVSLCPAGSSKFDAPCAAPPNAKVDVPAAFASASSDLDSTLTKLKAYKTDAAGNAPTEAKLKKFFKAGFDIDRLIRDYTRIKKQLGRVAKRDVGKSKWKKPGFRCATKCNVDCSDATAVTRGVGGGCRVTLCPSTWDGDKADAISTIIHEVSHCTPRIGLSRQGTDDVIYEREKAIPFLTTAESLRSADLFALFVHELVHGGPDTILPNQTDDVSALDPVDQRMAEELLARLAKWLQVSGDHLRSLYDEALRAKRVGWGTSWGRRLYKKIYKEFGKDLGLTKPSRRTKEKDVHAIAAIADRVTLLDNLVNDNKITATPGLLTSWSSKGKPPGILPGLEVEVDVFWYRIVGNEVAITILLNALLDASPHVSSAMAPKYLTLIDWIRKDEKIGP